MLHAGRELFPWADLHSVCQATCMRTNAPTDGCVAQAVSGVGRVVPSAPLASAEYPKPTDLGSSHGALRTALPAFTRLADLGNTP